MAGWAPGRVAAMTETRLYLAQRLSAAVIAPLVMIHLGVMIYAIQGGLSADEILGRTSGSFWWAANYGLFVVAVAVHAAIGLRNVLREWLGLRGMPLGLVVWAIFAGLLVTGLRAVYSVVAA